MLVSLIVAIVLIGLALWLINSFIPTDGRLKYLLNVVMIVLLMLYILQTLGLMHMPFKL